MAEWINYLDRLDKTVFEYIFLYSDPDWLVSLSGFLVKSYLLIPFLTLFFYYYQKFNRESGLKQNIWYAVILTLVLLAISENTASLFKNLFERHRPIYQLGIYISEGGYSFPSAHALNTMAFAAFWAGRFRASSGYVYSMSLVIGIARMLAHYHFPGDIIGGWTLGFILGKLFLILAEKSEEYYLKNKLKEKNQNA